MAPREFVSHLGGLNGAQTAGLDGSATGFQKSGEQLKCLPLLRIADESILIQRDNKKLCRTIPKATIVATEVRSQLVNATIG